MLRLAVMAGLAGLAMTSSAWAQAEFPVCSAPFDTLLGKQVFDAQPVPAPATALKPAAPLVTHGRARLYRTRLREGAKQAPNFAGHYTIIEIGCGAATRCPAILDAQTGQVFFPPELNSAEALLVDIGDVGLETLNYRLDSRVLVVAGTANENLGKDGLYYYVWRDDRLTLFRFLPTAEICGRG
jgi:hypothetical protein